MIARVAIAPPIELAVNGLPLGAMTALAPAFRQRSASRMSAVMQIAPGPVPAGGVFAFTVPPEAKSKAAPAVHQANGVQALYRLAPGNEKPLSYLMFKKTLQVEIADIAGLAVGAYNAKDRTADLYPAYQLGWFPDYSDASNFLVPFFVKDNFLVNHYDNPEVQELLDAQASETDKAAREQELNDIQELVANDISTLPLLQGTQIAVVGADVEGATLDGSFKFRYAPLNKQ